MQVKRTLWILSVLLFWMAGPAGAPIVLANSSARGTSGCVDDTWTATSTVGAPSARSYHTAVWTGSEMIVWGSGSGGGRYDPTTDTWTPISMVNAPSARTEHTVVWTGTEMIVWGGQDRFLVNTGGRYNPATDTWTPISLDGAPSGRSRHTAVWTGKEMIVWGGEVSFVPHVVTNTGGRYDPTTDTWAATSTEGAPSGRDLHTAVWTGTEMIVWGGAALGPYFNTGGRYDPATDTWAPTSTVGAPNARVYHTAVWTGREMIVWGGTAGYPTYFNTGGRYDPATDTWVATSTDEAPRARANHTAVWTGTEMIVWGGGYYVGFTFHYLNTGGRYNPATDTWTPISLDGAPSGRYGHTAVWTGSEMIVWAGNDRDDDCGLPISTDTGAHYCASAAGEGQ